MEKRGRRLYRLTLALEGFGAFARFPLAYLPVALGLGLVTSPVMLLIGIAADDETGEAIFELYFNLVIGGTVIGSLLAGVFPLINSARTLRSRPSDTRWTRIALGARQLSADERRVVNAALEQVAHSAPPGVLGPTAIYAIDGSEENAYVIGTQLFLTWPMIRSPYLSAVIAHELGHLNSLDGRLTLALRRLVLPPFYVLGRITGRSAPGATLLVGRVGGPGAGCVAGCLFSGLALLFALGGGGIGLLLLRPFWLAYFREREYAADEFAARLGQGAGLIEFLRRYQFFDVAVPYFGGTHPSTELRIERLLYLEEEAE